MAFDEYSKGTRRFLGVTCSFIDNQWKLKFQRVSVESFPKTTTGSEIAAAVQLNIQKMKVESVVASTRDGGSNVVKSCKIMKIEDIHCYDHVLNLGISYAYKNSTSFILIEKAKTLSASFTRSPTATLNLRECGAIYSMKSACCTRWNWMGRIIKCLLLNWEALEKYAYHHSEGKKSSQRRLILDFDDNDLATLREFNKVFTFFEEQFQMAESRTALASSILYMAYQISEVIKKGSNNPMVADFLQQFYKNFEPRVKKYKDSEIIKIATFLDPRFCFKLQLYSKQEWETIKKLIIDKFDIEVMPPVVEIQHNGINGNNPVAENQDNGIHGNNSDNTFSWVSFEDDQITAKTSSKLKVFLIQKLKTRTKNKNSG